MQTQNISPVTNQGLPNKQLTPNDRLKAAIQAFHHQRDPSPPPLPGNSAPSAPLPTGWQPMSSGGRPLYVNQGSGEISHEQPLHAARLAAGAAPVFLSRQGNAVFKQRAPVQYTSVWEWESDDGASYAAFNDGLAVVLEAHFLRHARQRSDETVNFSYQRPEGGVWIFNFVSALTSARLLKDNRIFVQDFMMQTNPATNGKRAIRRR
jgi:hypothetical protein